MRPCTASYRVFPIPSARVLGLSLCLLAAAGTCGEAASGGFSGVITEIDAWHMRISDAIATPIERIDRFFADDRFDDESRHTRTHVGVGMAYDQEGGLVFRSDVRVRLVFPRIENRLQLFVDNALDAEESELSQRLNDILSDTETETGFRLVLLRDMVQFISLDLGTRLGSPVQGFCRLRGRWTHWFEAWEMRMTQSVLWFTEDGFAETTEMRWSRPLAQKRLLRSVSSLSWEETTRGVTPAQALLLLGELSPRSGYKLSLSGRWPGAPEVDAANYSIAVNYRRLIHRDWLFLELSTGVNVAQESDYRENAFLHAMLEIVFCDD